MAIGSVIGRNIADAIDNTMNPQSTSPPIPTAVYYVAQNGVQTGPFDLAALRQMVENNLLTPQTLAWKAGMAQWA